MPKDVIFSCHAASNGETFIHGRDLTFYYFRYDTLHNGLAHRAFTELRSCAGDLARADAYWDTLYHEQHIRASHAVYQAGSDIEDYDVWSLGADWAGDTGVFDFADARVAILAFPEPATLGAVLATMPDVETVFWLACNA
jgi:hypothetical protein